ncbi:MAG: hypothetical protein Q7U51_13415 [Methanoregula sp.]|nr:hypothetical protein [Methanoregula sp.]
MPGLDGMGSEGSSLIIGRELGGCRIESVLVQEPVDAAQPAHNENGPVISQGSAQDIPVYGRGRWRNYLRVRTWLWIQWQQAPPDKRIQYFSRLLS